MLLYKIFCCVQYIFEMASPLLYKCTPQLSEKLHPSRDTAERGTLLTAVRHISFTFIKYCNGLLVQAQGMYRSHDP